LNLNPGFKTSLSNSTCATTLRDVFAKHTWAGKGVFDALDGFRDGVHWPDRTAEFVFSNGAHLYVMVNHALSVEPIFGGAVRVDSP
jgi:hypothetical protein